MVISSGPIILILIILFIIFRTQIFRKLPFIDENRFHKTYLPEILISAAFLLTSLTILLIWLDIKIPVEFLSLINIIGVLIIGVMVILSLHREWKR